MMRTTESGSFSMNREEEMCIMIVMYASESGELKRMVDYSIDPRFEECFEFSTSQIFNLFGVNSFRGIVSDSDCHPKPKLTQS